MIPNEAASRRKIGEGTASLGCYAGDKEIEDDVLGKAFQNFLPATSGGFILGWIFLQ